MTNGSTTVRYRAVAWLTLLAALSYLCRNAPGVAESTIRRDMQLTGEQSGWFMGAFFWTYAIFQVPSGWFVQRYGTRISLTIFALAWSSAAFGIGVAPGLLFLIIAQLMMGIAQAGIFPAACNSISDWVPVRQRSLACGILSAGMQVGAIVSGALAGKLLEPLGWRRVFIVFSMPGILFGFWFLLRFRDRPEQVATISDAEIALIRAGRESRPQNDRVTATSTTNWLTIFSSPALWPLCAQQICRAGAYIFFANWFPTFVQKTRGVSIEASGYLQSIVLAGTLAGSIVGGIVVDWVWRRTKNLRLSRSAVGAVACGVCGCLLFTSWFVESPGITVTLLALGSFFAAVAGPCAYCVTIDIGGTRVPQVFGLMNMFGNIAAGVCAVLVGKLFDWTTDWNLVLLVFAAVYATAGVCWAFVDPGADSKI